MVCLVAGLAECNEVVGSITSCLAAFQMVNIQNFVSTLSFAMLALVPVPCKYILSDIPKPHLFALLILNTLNRIVLYLLGIKLSDLDGCFGYRKQGSP